MVDASPLRLRLWSHDYSASRELRGYQRVQLTQEFGCHIGQGELQVPSTHPLASRIMQASTDVVPITADNGNGWHWTGQIKDPIAEGTPGSEVITCTLVDDVQHLYSTYCWPSTRTGLALQGKRDFQVGPLRTVVTHYVVENLARAGVPCYVMLPPTRINDKSPHVNVAAQMHPIGEVISPLLEQHEYHLDVRMWVPGDDFPDGKMIALPDGLSQLERFHRVNIGQLDNTFAPSGPRKWEPTTPGLLVQIKPIRERKHVRFSTRGRGIEHIRLAGKSPGAVTSIAGGKSDEWVNQAINFSIDAAVQGILVALGSLAGPAGAVIGRAIGGFAQSQLADTILAYQSRTDVQRAARMGPFHPKEAFSSSSAGAFTLDTSQLTERQLVEANGGQAIELELTDGIAITLGDDVRADNGKIRRGYRVGDRCTFEEHLSGTVFDDIITGVEVTDEPEKRMRVKPRVGKRRNLSNPWLDFADGLQKILQVQHDLGLS